MDSLFLLILLLLLLLLLLVPGVGAGAGAGAGAATLPDVFAFAFAFAFAFPFPFRTVPDPVDGFVESEVAAACAGLVGETLSGILFCFRVFVVQLEDACSIVL